MIIVTFLKKIIYFLDLFIFYFYDLTVSAFKVSYDVLTSKDHSNPRFVEYETMARSDAELAVLASLITFSPGTIVVDLSMDKKRMLLHVMLSGKDEDIKSHIKNKLEMRLIRILK